MSLLLFQRQFTRSLPLARPSTFHSVSRLLSSVDACTGKDIRECGAWTVLAGLEKSKEATNVQVAHLVSSLGYLLPSTKDTSAQHTFPRPSHSSDPAFFSFSTGTLSPTGWTKEHVVELLQATLRGRRIEPRTVEALLTAATQHFLATPSVVTIPSLKTSEEVTVVGDLHGSLTDLNTVLGLMGDPSANNRIIFNGDLADRGDHGIEVVAVVCALVLAFPQHVYVNRGNHEDLSLSVAYGLAAELDHKYGTTSFRHYWRPLLDGFFKSLPLCTVVEGDALVVHAGPPPPGWTLQRMKEALDDGQQRRRRLASRTSRARDQAGDEVDVLVESCLWSDPDVDEWDGTLVNYRDDRDHLKPNVSRGAGFRFDATIVQQLLEQEGLQRLIRSHEPVHKGCARYAVGGSDNHLELFTVFSASRYPYKQGFNYGAILKLQANGKHHIYRYSTEEDDPITTTTTAEQIKEEQSTLDTVDSATIRRALKEAIAPRRMELEEAYEEAGEDISFVEAVDVLVRTLHLEGEGLRQPGAMLALAQALTDDDELTELPEEHLDILGVLDAWFAEDDNDAASVGNTGSSMASGWLKAVFSMVDSNHDNEIDREEWLAAVASINASLPEGTAEVDAEATWKLLDRNGDGHVTASEWSTLAAITCR